VANGPNIFQMLLVAIYTLYIYKVSKKSNPPPLNLCIYFNLGLSSTEEILASYLPFIFSSMYQFWSTYLNICENCNNFVT